MTLRFALYLSFLVMTLPASCFDVVSPGAEDVMLGLSMASINVRILYGGKIVIDHLSVRNIIVQHQVETCQA